MIATLIDFLDSVSGTWVSVGTLLATLLGVLLAYRQWLLDLRAKRIDYLIKTILSIHGNPEIKTAYNIFEYDKPWYNNKFDDEKKEYLIDRLLFEFNAICYYKQKKIVIEEDFKLIEYFLHTILTDKHLHKYLFEIYHYSRSVNVACPFQSLIDYAKEKNFLDNDFFHKDSPAYS